MDLKLVTDALDRATGRFPESPLAGVDAEPLSVIERSFRHAGLPYVLRASAQPCRKVKRAEVSR